MTLKCLHYLVPCIISLYDNGIGMHGRGAVAAAVRAAPCALTDLGGVNLCTTDPDLPLELKRADNRRILNFYRDLLVGSVVQRRCRVMLLGNGGAGKTTLARCLVAGGVPDGVTAGVTHGVEQCALLAVVAPTYLLHPFISPFHVGWESGSVTMPSLPWVADGWTVKHTDAACVPADAALEVTITDFGGQVRLGVV